MRNTALTVVLLLLMLVSADATVVTTKLTFWMSTYYNAQVAAMFLPLQGHAVANAGQAGNAAVNSVAMPVAGNITNLAVVVFSSTAPVTRGLAVAINGTPSAATCTTSTLSCGWTGSVAVSMGDKLTLQYTGANFPTDSPLNGQIVFVVTSITGPRTWPYTAKLQEWFSHGPKLG